MIAKGFFGMEGENLVPTTRMSRLACVSQAAAPPPLSLTAKSMEKHTRTAKKSGRSRRATAKCIKHPNHRGKIIWE
jgi:hypothetical protein